MGLELGWVELFWDGGRVGVGFQGEGWGRGFITSSLFFISWAMQHIHYRHTSVTIA